MPYQNMMPGAPMMHGGNPNALRNQIAQTLMQARAGTGGPMQLPPGGMPHGGGQMHPRGLMQRPPPVLPGGFPPPMPGGAGQGLANAFLNGGGAMPPMSGGGGVQPMGGAKSSVAAPPPIQP